MHLLTLAITLFFVLDPFGNLPVALGLLTPLDPRRRWRIVLRESFIALGVLVLFYVAGPWFIGILGVGSSDLSICSGVVLGLIALKMIFPDNRTTTATETQSEPFIVPIAIPLVAGPSALATVMIMAAQSTSNPLAGLAMITLAWFATTVLLVSGVIMGSYIPPRILNAFERLSGLLLAVIAVHMLMTGIQSYLIVSPSHGG